MGHNCTEKRQYRKKEAMQTRNHAEKNGRQLRVYQCNHCDFWHLTKYDRNGFKIKKKIRKNGKQRKSTWNPSKLDN